MKRMTISNMFFIRSRENVASRFIPSGLTLTLAGLLLVSPAIAQEIDPPITATSDRNVESNLEETIVSGSDKVEAMLFQPENSTALGMPASTLDLPMTVTTIPNRVIEDQQALRLEDVFRNAPNVQESPTKANSQSIHIPFVRGFQTNGIYRNGFFYGNGANVNVASIDRVEIVKGPNSVLYGLMEPGGVVNYITKKPLDHYLFEPVTIFDSHGRKEFRLDSGGPLTADGDVRFRLNLSTYDNDLFTDYEFAKGTFVAPAFEIDLSESTTLELDFSYLNEDRLDTAVVGFFADRDVPAWSPETYVGPGNVSGKEQEEFFSSAVLTHEFSDTLRLRAVGGYHLYDLDLNEGGAEIFGGVPSSGLVDLSAAKIQQRGQDWVGRSDLLWNVSTGPVDHDVMVGVDVNYHDQWRRQATESGYYGTVNVRSPNPPPVPVYNPSEIPRSSGETLWYGTFLQDQASLFNDQLHVLGGLRYDTVEQNSTSYDGVSSSQNSDAFTGRFGVLWDATSWLAPYGSWSQSFVPNEATTVAGDLLQPEEGNQIEGGIKMSFADERLVVTTSAFSIEKDHIAVDDPTTTVPGSVDGGSVKSEGVEIEVAGQITDQLQILAGYGHLDTEVVKSNALAEGSRLQGVPDNSANLWVTYDFADDSPLAGFGVGGGVFYRDDLDSQFSQFVGGVTVDSSITSDFSIWYRRELKPGLSTNISLTLRNAFDEEYFVGGFGHGMQAGEPRTLITQIGLRYEF